MILRTFTGELVRDALNRIIDYVNGLESALTGLASRLSQVESVQPGTPRDVNHGLYRVTDDSPLTVEEVLWNGAGYTAIIAPSATYPAENSTNADTPIPVGTILYGRKHCPEGGSLVVILNFGSPGTTMFARITGSSAGTGADVGKWGYAFAEAYYNKGGGDTEYNGWDDVTSGLTGTAYNEAEVADASYYYRPVPDNTIVELHTTLVGSTPYYWFHCPMNQDQNPGEATINAANHSVSTTAETDTFNTTAAGQQGEGASIKCIMSIAYDGTNHKFIQKYRTLTFDDSMRLVSFSAETVEDVVTLVSCT